MKVLSVNVGLPRKILFNGQTVTTAILKDPVTGPVMLRKLNIDGDKQADLTHMAGWIRQFILTPKNTMVTGVNSFLTRILCGECLERISPLKD